MRHGVVGNRLNRDAAHRKAMLKNLATSVLIKGMAEEQMERHVVTTVPKAKAVRGLVDRLITYAKQGDLAARRQAARFVRDKKALQGLFEMLGPRYASRQGGYTRVLKLSKNRHGDNAEMAIVSLVEDEIRQKPKKKPSRKKAKQVKKVDITKSEEVAAKPGAGEGAETAPEASAQPAAPESTGHPATPQAPGQSAAETPPAEEGPESEGSSAPEAREGQPEAGKKEDGKPGE